jgi:hypothetical protein
LADVCPAEGAWQNVVIIPSSYLGDFLLANGTDAVLRLPQADKLPSSSQVIDHFDIETLLKIRLPLRVKGVGIAFYLDVALVERIRRIDYSPALSLC